MTGDTSTRFSFVRNIGVVFVGVEVVIVVLTNSLLSVLSVLFFIGFSMLFNLSRMLLLLALFLLIFVAVLFFVDFSELLDLCWMLLLMVLFLLFFFAILLTHSSHAYVASFISVIT